jgi:hypothetical protein
VYRACTCLFSASVYAIGYAIFLFTRRFTYTAAGTGGRTGMGSALGPAILSVLFRINARLTAPPRLGPIRAGTRPEIFSRFLNTPLTETLGSNRHGAN